MIETEKKAEYAEFLRTDAGKKILLLAGFGQKDTIMKNNLLNLWECSYSEAEMKTIIDFEFTDDNGILIKDAFFQTVHGEKYSISVDVGDLNVKKTCLENASAVRDHIFYLLGVAHCKSDPRIKKGTITVTKL